METAVFAPSGFTENGLSSSDLVGKLILTPVLMLEGKAGAVFFTQGISKWIWV